MKLMHCPFCGEIERVRILDIGQSYIHRFTIICDACDAQGPSGTSIDSHLAREVAIDVWNGRLAYDEDLVLRTTFELEG
jgi:hypothetical protein